MPHIQRLNLLAGMLGGFMFPRASARAARYAGLAVLALAAATALCFFLAGCAAPTRADIFSPQGPVNFPVPGK